MDLFANLWLGMSVALTPTNLMFLMIGAMVGMLVGIIPGFGPSAGIAILMPLTFGMDPIGAVVMLAAIYYAAMYGGTITSILLNTPGESATVASTFDGYPLAQQGRAGPALVMAAAASFVGGTIGVVLITLLAPLFSQVARGFGPPEYFLLAMMGMLCLVVMVGSDWRYGVISGLIGFALGTVGVDLETGQQRFTFGSAQLIDGIDFIPIAIGLFGLGELFYAFYRQVPGGVQRLGDLQVGSPDELLADLLATNDEYLLVGDGALRYREHLCERSGLEFAEQWLAYPSAAPLVQLAHARALREDWVNPWELDPIYLRKPDAAINWSTRDQRAGPAAAAPEVEAG